MEKKVTRKQFDYFCQRVEYWMKEFGEGGWNLHFRLKRLKEYDAQIHYNSQNRTVTFALGDRNDLQTKKYLNMFALHEVTHLVTSELDNAAHDRFGITEKKLIKMEEKLVNKIVAVILSQS